MIKPSRVGEGVINKNSDYLYRNIVNEELLKWVGSNRSLPLDQAQTISEGLNYDQLREKVRKKAIIDGRSKVGNIERRQLLDESREH